MSISWALICPRNLVGVTHTEAEAKELAEEAQVHAARLAFALARLIFYQGSIYIFLI